MTIKDTMGIQIQTNNAILGYVGCVWNCGIPHGNLMGQMMNDKPVHLMGVLFETNHNKATCSMLVFWPVTTELSATNDPKSSKIQISRKYRLSKDIHKQ